MKRWLEKIIANHWLRKFILVGYAAKGVIYLLIGLQATQAALFAKEKPLGTYLILSSFLRQPLGGFFLCLLAFGLMGYVLRRFLQVIREPRKSNSLKIIGIVHRLGYIISGLSYAGIAYSALNITLELGEYDDTIQDLVSELFEQPPLGKWLIFFGGITVVSIGISYIYGACTGSYISEFRSSEIDDRVEWWAKLVGKLGLSARGVAFILIGIFLIQAALYANPEAAGGLQNAFRTLAQQPLGWLWVLLVGTGFIAYGLYMFFTARYLRFPIR
ncbi:DUF1206 domain-containing protein [Mastigocoleus testarum]|uniref:DUF1206 domain-containing protein n=1 Tax=Mastigocoleus testarum BC008 TaxID=371196 RepID=A0A0V7ZZM4_9CYAN|nr:DUF1206 domain-containing protein [Mastigocoleus testarum]KST70004.1 hypothetical protein BC008_06085 [Mastigocoleus testarum BC008]